MCLCILYKTLTSWRLITGAYQAWLCVCCWPFQGKMLTTVSPGHGCECLQLLMCASHRLQLHRFEHIDCGFSSNGGFDTIDRLHKDPYTYNKVPSHWTFEVCWGKMHTSMIFSWRSFAPLRRCTMKLGGVQNSFDNSERNILPWDLRDDVDLNIGGGTATAGSNQCTTWS